MSSRLRTLRVQQVRAQVQALTQAQALSRAAMFPMTLRWWN